MTLVAVAPPMDSDSTETADGDQHRSHPDAHRGSADSRAAPATDAAGSTQGQPAHRSAASDRGPRD